MEISRFSGAIKVISPARQQKSRAEIAKMTATPLILPQEANAEQSRFSGKIINVLTSMPNQIVRELDENGKPVWNVEATHGQHALYALNAFLGEHTNWETHLVAWTGELVDKIRDTDRIDAENIVDDPLYLLLLEKDRIQHRMQQATPHLINHPVWLLRRDQLRWRKYAENVLWPVFHYIQGLPLDGTAETDAWYDYVRFNEAYANKIRQIYRPGDVVWIHDYYLLLLPQILRMSFPGIYVGMYIHAPFPSSEYFRCISKRQQLLDGMLGADVIAFQLRLFQRHFVSCCARVLGSEASPDMVLAYGLETKVATLPIGINVAKIEDFLFSDSSASCARISAKVDAIRAAYPGARIIIGRDRLDPVRGIAQKIQAFDMLLQMFPQYRRKVVLIQVLTPGFGDQRALAKRLSELVNRVNARYGDFGWTPILHYQMRIDRDEYWALLRVADLALVTSIRDGMSTSSLEFIVAQRDNCLPLILSEFSGTAAVMPHAILVNPWDAVGVARQISECLEMPPEQKKRLESQLFAAVLKNTIQNWTASFMNLLVKQVSKLKLDYYTPALNRPLLLSQYQKAQRRLFLFDYDGTLTPIVKDPAAAIPTSRLNCIVSALAADERNRIWIISGRDANFLSKWFGKHHVGLLAEHGCFMRDVGGGDNWINLAEKFDMKWQERVIDVFDRYTDQTPGAEVERKKVAVTWHYRRADPELGKFQAEKCVKELEETVVKDYDVEVMTGKANIEVRPRFLNKGEIVRRLVLLPHGTSQDLETFARDTKPAATDEIPDFVMCVGDDVTDESMFSLLEKIEREWKAKERPVNSDGSYGVFTVAVGPASKKTIATAHLNEPSQVLETLGLLAGKVSVFESPGLVELDDRGHIKK